MTFEVEVVETQAVTVLYEIEARSEEEARTKATIGDTVSETSLSGCGEVLHREITGMHLVDSHSV